MYDVIIGHYGEVKNIPFGGQKLSYRVETLHTGWRPLALQHISRFFENFKKIVFCDHFSKKVFFWNFWGQKSKILKIRDSHFVDLAFLCIIPSCLHLTQKLYFWWILKHLPFSAPNRVKWRHKIRPIAKNVRPILIFFARDDAKLMPGEVCQVSCRYSNKCKKLFRKNRGGGVGFDPPPRRWRVNTRTGGGSENHTDWRGGGI